MSYLFDATGENISGTFTSAVSAFPVTLACFVKQSDWTSLNANAVSISDDTADTNDQLVLRAGSTDNSAEAVTYDGSGGSSAATDTDTAANLDGAWVPLVATFDSASDRTIHVRTYANSTTETTAESLTVAFDSVCLGNQVTNTGAHLGGYLAECAIWDIALSQTQIEEYMRGEGASGIAPTDLIGYWPLYSNNATQSNEGVDATGDLTVSGATHSSDHPCIITSVSVDDVVGTSESPQILGSGFGAD